MLYVFLSETTLERKNDRLTEIKQQQQMKHLHVTGKKKTIKMTYNMEWQ